MAAANTTTTGKSAQTTTRLSEKDIPKAIERYCLMFPDALQPSSTDSSVIGNGRYIALANISGPLVYMTTRWNFIESIAGQVPEGESQLSDEISRGGLQ